MDWVSVSGCDEIGWAVCEGWSGCNEIGWAICEGWSEWAGSWVISPHVLPLNVGFGMVWLMFEECHIDRVLYLFGDRGIALITLLI